MQFISKIREFLSQSLGGRYKGYSDEELVEMFVRDGDQDAFGEILHRHLNYVYGLAYRITRDHEATEEIVQEVMLQLSQKAGTFSGRAKFSSWLYRVVANASYSYLRSSKRHESDVSLDDYAPYDSNGTLKGRVKSKAWSDAPDSVLYSKEAMDVIDEAVASLPEMYRAVFVLRDVEGFSNQEVAETLGISVPAVKTRLHRARLALRDRISDYFSEWGRKNR